VKGKYRVSITRLMNEKQNMRLPSNYSVCQLPHPSSSTRVFTSDQYPQLVVLEFDLRNGSKKKSKASGYY